MPADAIPHRIRVEMIGTLCKVLSDNGGCGEVLSVGDARELSATLLYRSRVVGNTSGAAVMSCRVVTGEVGCVLFLSNGRLAGREQLERIAAEMEAAADLAVMWVKPEVGRFGRTRKTTVGV